MSPTTAEVTAKRLHQFSDLRVPIRGAGPNGVSVLGESGLFFSDLMWRLPGADGHTGTGWAASVKAEAYWRGECTQDLLGLALSPKRFPSLRSWRYSRILIWILVLVGQESSGEMPTLLFMDIFNTCHREDKTGTSLKAMTSKLLFEIPSIDAGSLNSQHLTI